MKVVVNGPKLGEVVVIIENERAYLVKNKLVENEEKVNLNEGQLSTS